MKKTSGKVSYNIEIFWKYGNIDALLIICLVSLDRNDKLITYYGNSSIQKYSILSNLLYDVSSL